MHGVGNMYVAGSSVFQTAGANFPTITLVALALRLSDHLAEQLVQPDAVAQTATARTAAPSESGTLVHARS
jgi:choline dehydrogenase-like flavoprotein